ncbi:homoserine dehydrogenase [Alkalimarinus alittae]|uniref:Homoserine dehydrogenase n=1 Tax=Alkalimarinus alittae TaxID=2961619 RepID=A0ABY6MZJ5_9ALTE|nr:homoserine dehydrogenase [Alkalimarinus alittae]UZE95244.1 homoserine dehydrogenase [Alkalimarinus alittae]
MKLGICGLGTVASGAINVLKRNAESISGRAGCPIEVIQVGSRRLKDNCDLTGIGFTTELFDVVTNPDVDIVIELIGGYDLAKELVLKAIENGKHVVTANKALIAVHGNEIFAAAAEKNVTVAYEAAVAGGIPIIKALREGMAANKINWLAGIINGTGNFILTEMKDKGREFSDVLKEAQALGYAEADPTFDVEGIDAAHKLTIMASAAFGVPLQFDAAYTEGISELSTDDVVYAEELGYRIKHLGITRQHSNGIELRVHPTLVPEQQLLAKVDGVMNSVLVDGDAVGQTLYYGAGAGSEATASAVIADVVDIARAINAGAGVLVPYLGFSSEKMTDLPVLPMDEIYSAYYLRISANDHPGVLAKVASILSAKGINIESVMQKESELHEGMIPMIMLTHKVKEARINEAIAEIEELTEIEGKVVRIRAEHFAS